MLTHTVRLIEKIDPLKYLLDKVALTRRLEKWVMILSKFDIQYVGRRAIKGQVITDQLAEAPLQDHHPMNIEFLDVDIMNITTQ